MKWTESRWMLPIPIEETHDEVLQYWDAALKHAVGGQLHVGCRFVLGHSEGHIYSEVHNRTRQTRHSHRPAN